MLQAAEAFARTGQEPTEFLRRHWRGDWGEELDEHDRKENEFSRVYAQLALATCQRAVWTFTKPQIVRMIGV